MNKKGNVFVEDGKNKFLINVDEGLKNNKRNELIEKKVIDGNVIKNNVIFKDENKKDKKYEKLDLSDNVSVKI
jgi:hypothetical protein